MTINSISENRSAIYQTSKNSVAASTQATRSNTNELYGLDETRTAKDAAVAENYSAAEHLAMMQSANGSLRYYVNGDENTTEAGDISTIDADGDGTISSDEYETMISQMGIKNALSAEDFFAAYDLNEDGEISADEMPEPGSVRAEKNSNAASLLNLSETEKETGDISSIDADGDGTISTDEYETMISQMGIQNALSAEEFFKQYDLNSDGEISTDEMPEPGTVGASSQSTATQSAPPELPPIELDEETFSQYDTDGDGVLSAAEFSAMMEALKPDDEEQVTTSSATNTSTDAKINQLENMNKLLLSALAQYEENYKSMFETLEGTELNSLA